MICVISNLLLCSADIQIFSWQLEMVAPVRKQDKRCNQVTLKIFDFKEHQLYTMQPYYLFLPDTIPPVFWCLKSTIYILSKKKKKKKSQHFQLTITIEPHSLSDSDQATYRRQHIKMCHQNVSTIFGLIFTKKCLVN